MTRNNTQRITAKQWREQKTKRAHKFGAEPTVVDGIRFDSKGEAKLYEIRRRQEALGAIFQLRTQVIFQFFKGHIPIDTWRIDFTWVHRDGVQIAEDYTGYMTRRKKKLMKLFREQYQPEWTLRITAREDLEAYL